MPPAVTLKNYISRGKLWRIFFPKLDFSRGFLYTYIIIFAVYLCTSARVCLDFGDFSLNSDLYIINMHGAWDIIFFRLPRSSLRVRHSSEGRSLAQKGCSVAHRVQRTGNSVEFSIS